MSTKAPKAEITYDSTIELARKALYLWGGPDHQEMAARFGEAVDKWLKDDKAVSNLEPEQAITLYRMIKRLLVDDEAVAFHGLLSPDQIAWNTKHPLRKPENALQIIGALQRQKGVRQGDAFNQALWDHLKSDFPKTIISPSADEVRERMTIFVVACQYSSPEMIEAIYRGFFEDMDPKPDLSKIQSPINHDNVAKAVCLRHMKGKPLTREWEQKLRDMGALRPDSIETVIENFISQKLQRTDGSQAFLPTEGIISLIQYWKSTQPKDGLAEKLQRFQKAAIYEGRLDLAQKLVNDPDIGEIKPENIQAEVACLLENNDPNSAKNIVAVFREMAIGEETLNLAYQKVDPFHPELMKLLRENGAALSAEQIAPLLDQLCSKNAVEELSALLDEVKVQESGSLESVRERLVSPDMMNQKFAGLLVEQGLGNRMGVLLELRRREAKLPPGTARSPANDRLIQACDYALAFQDMDKEIFLENLKNYADHKLDIGLNTKVKREAIKKMIQVLRDDPSEKVPDLLLRPIAIKIVPNANKLFPKGGLLGKEEVCLLDAMDYNRNPLAAKRRIEKYEPTTTMKVMKQQPPKELKEAVLASLAQIISRLEKKLGPISQLAKDDPGRVKYEKLQAIQYIIRGSNFEVKSLQQVLDYPFKKQDGTPLGTLLHTLNIQRGKLIKRSESTSLKMFMKDLHVKDIVKDSKNALSKPEKSAPLNLGEPKFK